MLLKATQASLTYNESAQHTEARITNSDLKEDISTHRTVKKEKIRNRNAVSIYVNFKSLNSGQFQGNFGQKKVPVWTLCQQLKSVFLGSVESSSLNGSNFKMNNNEWLGLELFDLNYSKRGVKPSYWLHPTHPTPFSSKNTCCCFVIFVHIVLFLLFYLKLNKIKLKTTITCKVTLLADC